MAKVGRVTETALSQPALLHGFTLGTTIFGLMAVIGSSVVTARSLGVEDRGYLALIVAVSSFILGVVLLGYPTAVTVEVAKWPEATGGIIRESRRILLTQMSVAFLLQLAVVAALFHGAAAHVLLPALLSSLFAPIMVVHTFATSIIQAKRRFIAFNVTRSLPAILYAALLVPLLLTSQVSIASAIVCWLFAGAVSACLAVNAILPYMSVPAHGASVDVMDIVRAGVVGFLGSASPLETFRVDQLFVGLVLNPAALGLYVTASALTSLPRLISQTVAMVALPGIAGGPTGIIGVQRARSFLRLSLVASCACGLAVIAVASRAIPFVFGESFRGAVEPAQILLCASIVVSVRRAIGEALRSLGYPGVGTRAELISWAVMAIVMAAAIPLWDLNGVALALLLAAMVSLIFVWREWRRFSLKIEGL